MKRILLIILAVLIIALVVSAIVYEFHNSDFFDIWGLLALLCFAIVYAFMFLLKKIAQKKGWKGFLEGTSLPFKIPHLQKYEKFAEAYNFLKRQKKIIASLIRNEVTWISIAFDSGTNARIQESELIKAFKEFFPGTIFRMCLQHEILVHRSKLQQLRLEIHTTKVSVIYKAIIHPDFPEDIILVPSKSDDYGGICLRGLKLWIDENVFGSGTAG
jgi:hypothetical protein